MFLPLYLDKLTPVLSSVQEAPVICSWVFRHLTLKKVNIDTSTFYFFASSALFCFAVLLHFIHVSSVFDHLQNILLQFWTIQIYFQEPLDCYNYYHSDLNLPFSSTEMM